MVNLEKIKDDINISFKESLRNLYYFKNHKIKEIKSNVYVFIKWDNLDLIKKYIIVESSLSKSQFDRIFKNYVK